jgi:hypothetical protein
VVELEHQPLEIMQELEVVELQQLELMEHQYPLESEELEAQDPHQL